MSGEEIRRGVWQGKFYKVFFKFLAISIQITFFFLAVNIDKFLSSEKVFNPLTIGKK
jgi:hypothetical protein